MRTLILNYLALMPLASFSLLSGSSFHTPLPTEVRRARTLGIINESNEQAFPDQARSAFRKWKRPVILSNAKETDLVLVLGREGERAKLSFFGKGNTRPFLVETLDSGASEAVRRCIDEFEIRLMSATD